MQSGWNFLSNIFENMQELYKENPDFAPTFAKCQYRAQESFYVSEGYLYKEGKPFIPQVTHRKILVKESHVMDLTPFAGNEDEEAEACDLRTNPFQDGGDDGRDPSSSPTTRSMSKRIQEYWDSATDGRETFLYMFKEDHKK